MATTRVDCYVRDDVNFINRLSEQAYWNKTCAKGCFHICQIVVIFVDLITGFIKISSFKTMAVSCQMCVSCCFVDSLHLHRLEHTQIYYLLCRVKTVQQFAMVTEEAVPHMHQQPIFHCLCPIYTWLVNSFIYPLRNYFAYQVLS